MKKHDMDIFMLMKISELTRSLNEIARNMRPPENPERSESETDKKFSMLVSELRNIKSAVNSLPHIAHAGGG